MADRIEFVRILLAYGVGLPTIQSAVLVDRPADLPIAVPPADGRGGAWLTVRDAAGAEVFRRALPDAGTAAEVFGEDAAISRRQEALPKSILIEVPWPGPGATITVQDLSGADAGLESAATALPIEPELPRELESAQPPLQVRAGWGSNNPKALTLLFLPDGFLAGEMAAFHAAIDQCVALFEATEPFRSMLPALRVASADLPSEQSGISGTTPRDTRFRGCFEVGIDRVILVDQKKAIDTLNSYVQHGTGVPMVVANTTTYGGSGGAALAFSCDPRAAEIAMHELGHSAFGLADEYSDAGQSATDDPVEPNVCGFGDRARLKWAALVPNDVPLPTLRAGDPPLGQAPALGAFEGAKYHASGRFRPALDCKMRTLGKPFCQVCSTSISTVLHGHLP